MNTKITNLFRDAVMVACGNCCTSFFAGFVIFGIIGFMAHELGVKVEDVAAQGIVCCSYINTLFFFSKNKDYKKVDPHFITKS